MAKRAGNVCTFEGARRSEQKNWKALLARFTLGPLFSFAALAALFFGSGAAFFAAGLAAAAAAGFFVDGSFFLAATACACMKAWLQMLLLHHLLMNWGHTC